MRYTALVVDTDREGLLTTSRLLAGAGYVVAPASTFADARRQLVTARPDVLVTTVRLAGYNGLHLVIGSRTLLPDLVSIVTHTGRDAALQADAVANGALYFSAPVDPKLLLDVVAQSLDARGPRPSRRIARRWYRKRLVHRVNARLCTKAGIVVDISYGGTQLQLRNPVKELPLATDPIVFAPDLRLGARRVWTRAASGDGPWWYGLELDVPAPVTQEAWQAFVDRLN